MPSVISAPSPLFRTTPADRRMEIVPVAMSMSRHRSAAMQILRHSKIPSYPIGWS